MSERPPKVYLSLAESAEYYSVSVSTMRRLVAEGLVPASRLGRKTIRIKRTDLEAAISSIPTARWSA